MGIKIEEIEHFVMYLLKLHYLDEEIILLNKLKKVYMLEYNVKYRTNIHFEKMLFSLKKNKFVEKDRHFDLPDYFIKFNKEKCDLLLPRIAEEFDPLELEESKTNWKKRIINQKVAFHLKNTDSDLPEARGHDTGCDVCGVFYTNDIAGMHHLLTEDHIVRMKYRYEKKTFTQNAEKFITIGDPELNTEELVPRPSKPFQHTIDIVNNSDRPCIIHSIFLLYPQKEIEMKTNHVFPRTLEAKKNLQLVIEVNFAEKGAFMWPIILKLTDESVSIYVLKEYIFRVQTELMDTLQPEAPYKNVEVNTLFLDSLPIIKGPTIVSEKSKNAVILPKFDIPATLNKALNAGLQENVVKCEKVKKQIAEVRKILGCDASNCLTANNYYEVLQTLIYSEEHQKNVNMHVYDKENQSLTESMSYIKMAVPGLSESKPSLIVGDFVYVNNMVNPSNRYQGVIHKIEANDIYLRFCNSFKTGVLANGSNSMFITFGFNRRTIRCEHQAVQLAKKHKIAACMFPTKYGSNLSLKKYKIQNWFNKLVENNPEQMQAVNNIINQTAYPAPYLVFGPPGTGKTVTVVEAIQQLYSLNKACHILVVVPSNSAANVITQRLTNIPSSALMRYMAKSYAWHRVPENIKQYCNYNKQKFCYQYPNLDHMKQYRIIVSTLCNAARLINKGIAEGGSHFDYVFIDESGQGTETESLIGIAGFLSSIKKPGEFTGQLVLAGDPKQLGPIIFSPLCKMYGLGVSLLERLMTKCPLYQKGTDNKYNSDVITKLVKNYRSNPNILSVPNKLFYDNELQTCGNDDINCCLGWSELPNKQFPVIFHNVQGIDEREGSSPSIFNRQEIEVAVDYIQKLLKSTMKGRKITESDIGVIAPYSKQVRKFEQVAKKLNWKNIMFGTVEQFQGQERLIIIITTVRSRKELVQNDYKYHVGFLRNPKRFNVAVTRPKALLITIGNPNILQCDRTWRQFIQFCVTNNAVAGEPFTTVDDSQPTVEEINFNLSTLTLQINDKVLPIEDIEAGLSRNEKQ